ncbi:MAG: hypothetical protein IJB57_01295 [Clostridia bacterium]|nr:hypothetical protein [Clostridia bacterium]
MNKLKFSNLNKKIIYLFLVCAVIFTAFQSFLVLKYYEADVYLYAHGTVLPTVFNVLISLFIIVVLVYCSLCTCEGYSDKLAKCSGVSRLFGLLASAALLAVGIYTLIGYNQRTAQLMYMSQKQDKFIFWSCMLSFGAFIYYFIFSILPEKLNKLKTLLGCITVVWHILYLLSVYFDMNSPLNDPIRLMNEFALVGIMMYLTVEIRYLCGIPKKGFYIGASTVAFTLLLCSSVSNILYALIVNGSLDTNIGIFVYQFFAAGYVLIRLLSQLKAKQ